MGQKNTKIKPFKKLKIYGPRAVVAFFLPFFMMLLLLLLCKIWPFGDNTLLTGDMGGIYLQVMASLRSSLLSGGGIFYSFSKSLGGEMLSSYASYGGVYGVLLLLVPAANLPDGVTILYLLQMGFMGLSIYCYLAPKMNHSSWWPVFFGVCYAFSSYTMAFLQNIMWLGTMVLAPLVALCIDRFASRKYRAGYTLFLGLAIIGNYYTGWMLCLFAALYWLFTTLSEGVSLNKLQPKAFSLPVFFHKLGQFIFHSLLAGGISSFLLLPVLRQAGAAKSLWEGFNFTLEQNFPPLSLFAELILGNFQTGYLAAWLPMLYCSFLVLLLTGLYFFNRSIPLFRRFLAGGVLGVFFFSFWLNLPNILWHALREPVWFSFRYSFLCILFVICLACECMAHPRGLPRFAVPLAGMAGLAGVLIATLRHPDIPKNRVLATAMVVICITAGLWLYTQKIPHFKNLTKLAVPLLGFIVVSEMLLHGFLIQRSFEWKSRSYYQEHAQAVETLLAQTGPDTGHRVEKTWFYTLNDPMLFNYQGAGFFNSLADDPPLAILRGLGMGSDGSTTYNLGAGGTNSGRILLGFSRMMGKDNAPPPYGMVLAAELDNYQIYTDPKALPVLFAAKQGAENVLLPSASPITGQNALYSALTGIPEPVLYPFGDFEVELSNLTAQPDPNQPGVTIYTTIDADKPSDILLNFTMPEDGSLCFQLYSADRVPVNLHHSSWYFEEYGSPDKGGILNCGWFKKGEQVSLAIGIGAGEIRLGDPALFIESDRVLQSHLSALQPGLPENLLMKNGQLSATVQAEQGQILFTTIPYDPAWKAYVDGVETPTTPSTLFLTLPLTGGTHLVELVYTPQGFGLGILISLASIALFCLWLFFTRPKMAKKKNLLSSAPPQ